MSFTPVKFGSQQTDDPLSSMFDVIAPIQSFLDYMGHGLDVLTSDSSVSRFLLLEQSFGNTGLSDGYSPWDSVDHFGRAQIRQHLEPGGASDESGPQVNMSEENAPLQPFQIPKTGKRHSHFLSGEELTESASRLVASCSKNYLYYMYNCILDFFVNTLVLSLIVSLLCCDVSLSVSRVPERYLYLLARSGTVI